MIVYGDPAFTVSPDQVARFFQSSDKPTLDQLRDLLIAAGQIEQAVADAGADDSAARVVTDQLALAFLATLRGGSVELNVAPAPFTGALRVKAPEGYAFYTVYPEQYARAAEEWTRSRRGSSRVLVVGIRSIGTSLSAVVRATLCAAGIDATRVTVRPAGHPFERTVELDLLPARFDQAIVVDEGPGLSGSSIAAAVTALRARGISDVTIFPSHPNPPGEAGSQNVRELWANTPKIVYPTLDESFEKSWICAALKQRSETLLNSSVKESHDLSAGQWRAFVGRPELKAVASLERAKFLFRAENGRALLWKFAGLGCGPGFDRLTEQAFMRQRRMGKIGWSSPPIAVEHGFVAVEWVDAPQANAAELSIKEARQIARYIMDAARLPQPEDAEANLNRLKEMAFCNVREALGEEPADRLRKLADRILPSEEMPLYGDGRLAPHEWLRSGDRLMKTDIWGHDFDHTCIGPQSILWDIAGALSEWEMRDRTEDAFCQEMRTAGLVWRPEELTFYKTAYCAFRLGIAKMFGDDDEALRHELARYLVR